MGRGAPRQRITRKGPAVESQKKRQRTFSVEFFPPRNAEGHDTLRETIAALTPMQPAFYSVTFGAGGSTKTGTYETVKEIAGQGLTAVPHISGITSSHDEVRELLASYRALGIRRLVVLRGDLPPDMPVSTGAFRYAAELVRFIRRETGNTFHLEVAAYPEYHPQAASASADIDHFVEKVRAGASAAITQYFFNVDAYERFVAECESRGVDLAIVPGIMPITNYKQLARFSDACGAEIPRWIRRRLEGYGDDLASIRAFGLDVVSALCDRLLTLGAPGLHFYTLNRAVPTLAIWERLGLKR